MEVFIMKKLKLNCYMELKNKKEILSLNEYIVNLEACSLKDRIRIIDFFVGMTILEGSITKLNRDELQIIINKKCALSAE